ncbi:hypothetical protein [Spongiactinospora gelatinilytica]|uniref:hypothetical protein n=1 Tax=Spongiactinospora gelatinilytica TaxID=2666298 RepID=UPI0011B9424E|nr:hypothetical protein [Spongiactinospora gelatinilytica]
MFPVGQGGVSVGDLLAVEAGNGDVQTVGGAGTPTQEVLVFGGPGDVLFPVEGRLLPSEVIGAVALDMQIILLIELEVAVELASGVAKAVFALDVVQAGLIVPPPLGDLVGGVYVEAGEFGRHTWQRTRHQGRVGLHLGMHHRPQLVDLVQTVTAAELEELVVGPDVGDQVRGDIGQTGAHHLDRLVDRAAELHGDREVVGAGGVDRYVDRGQVVLGHVHDADALAVQHMWLVAAQPPVAQHERAVVLEYEPLVGELAGQAGDQAPGLAQEPLLGDRIERNLADHRVAHGRFPMVSRDSTSGLKKIRSSDRRSSSRFSSVLREMA